MEWNEGCQEAFKKVKQYLEAPPILVLATLGKPLILYLTMLEESMGGVLGQQDTSGKKEQAIYYLSKKFIDCEQRYSLWFDGASNLFGKGIGALLASPKGQCFHFSARLSFDYTNNIAEYEVNAIGVIMAIEHQVKMLKVFDDSALVIYQLRGEWETRDAKLIPYHDHIMEMSEYFDKITFHYVPRDEN
ncbi:hypothetical protein CR513_11485, partial [Mucuna pruriens]